MTSVASVTTESYQMIMRKVEYSSAMFQTDPGILLEYHIVLRSHTQHGTHCGTALPGLSSPGESGSASLF